MEKRKSTRRSLVFAMGLVIGMCCFGKAPTAYALPYLWLDGSDVNGDGSAMANGTSIHTWKNKGRAGVTGDVVAPTPDQQPTYNSTGLNGKPGIRFDGDDQPTEATADVLRTSTVDDWSFLTNGTSYSVFAVVDVADTIVNGQGPRNSGIFGTGDESTGADMMIWEASSSIGNSGDRPQYQIIPGPGGPPVRDDDVANDDAAVYRVSYNAGDVDLVHNGTVHASKEGFPPGINNVVLDVGARGAERDMLEGVLAEIIMFDQELTVDQIIGVEQLVGDYYEINVTNVASQQQIDSARALFPVGSKYGMVPEPSALTAMVLAVLSGLTFSVRKKKR